jgi:tetratricopeptide (TPR) repeat protein
MGRKSRDWKREAKARRARRAKSFGPSALSSRVRDTLSEAYALLQRGRVGEACRELQRLDREQPDQPEVLRALLDAYYAQQNWGPYCAAAKRLLERRPDDPDLWLMVAGGCLARGLPSAALLAFRTFRERWPDSPLDEGAAATVADLERELPSLLEELGLTGENALTLGALHDEVLLWLEEGHFARAVREGERLLAMQPGMTTVLNNVSAAYFQLGDTAGAIRTARRVLESQPGNVQATGNLVRFLMLSGQIEQAQAVVADLRSLPVVRPQDWVKKAEVFELLGDDAGVLEALRGSEPVRDQIDPPHLALLYHFGAVAHLRQDRIDEAREHWQLARKADPTLQIAKENLDDLAKPSWERHAPWPFPISHWLRQEAVVALTKAAEGGQRKRASDRPTLTRDQCLEKHPELVRLIPVLLDRGDSVAREFAVIMVRWLATPELTEALRQFVLSQRGPDKLRMNSGMWLHRQGVLPQGSQRLWIEGEWRELLFTGMDIYFEPEIEHTGQVLAWATDAYAALEDGKWARAEALLRKAIELKPDAPDLRNNLATALQMQERHAEAEQLIDEIHRLHPDYLFARVSLVARYVREGDLQRAQEMLDPLTRLTRMHITEYAAYCQATVVLHLALDEWDAAEAILKGWASVDPGHPQLKAMQRHVQAAKLDHLTAEWRFRGRSF